MRVLRSLLLVSTLVLAASPTVAQTKRMKFISGGSTVFRGVYVGPYVGQVVSMPGQPMIDIFCVDYLNGVRIGQQWDANWTQLNSGDLSKTRFNNLVKYQQAAWLSSQFKIQDKSEWGSMDYAIWNITTPGTPLLSNAANGAYWLAQAQANYSSVNLADWVVITDVNTVNGVGGTQEYLTQNVVPEPATLLLLGTGVLGLGLAGFFKRSV